MMLSVCAHVLRSICRGQGTTHAVVLLVAVNKAERNQRSEEHFDIRHGDAEFGICPAGFRPCCGPVFPCYAPSPPVRNGNVHPGLLSGGGM